MSRLIFVAALTFFVLHLAHGFNDPVPHPVDNRIVGGATRGEHDTVAATVDVPTSTERNEVSAETGPDQSGKEDDKVLKEADEKEKAVEKEGQQAGVTWAVSSERETAADRHGPGSMQIPEDVAEVAFIDLLMNDTLTEDHAKEALKAAALHLNAKLTSEPFRFSSTNLCWPLGGQKPKSWKKKTTKGFSQADAVRACAACAAGNRFYSCGPYPDATIVCPSWSGNFVPVVVVPSKAYHLGFVWGNIPCWNTVYKAGTIIKFTPRNKPAIAGTWLKR